MERLDGRVALLEPPAKPSPKDFRKACVKPSSAETSPESFSGSTGAESVLEHLGEAISARLDMKSWWAATPIAKSARSDPRR
jgi:hypothetical protein